MNNFKLVNCDTDSIMVCKTDSSPFSEDEKQNLLKELNNQFPENIKWEDDGFFKKVIILKAKNYILWDGKKLKTKGSSIRDPKREIALQMFMNEIIQSMIDDKQNYVEIYNRYVKEITNIQDINRWKCKKTISSKVLKPSRTQEQKILDAIEGSEYSEGDKAYFYYKGDESLELVEKFNGDYNVNTYLSKLYKTAHIFSSVINKDMFINYSLKREKKKLCEI